MSLIQQFFEVVSEIYRHTEGLLTIAGEKRDILLRKDMDALQEITGREMMHIRQIGILEDQRLEIGKSIAETYRVPQESITLGWIQQQASPIERLKIHNLSVQYQTAISKIQELNSTNRKLLEQSLGYVNFMLEVITEPVPPAGNYRPVSEEQGISLNNRGTSLFDQRV